MTALGPGDRVQNRLTKHVGTVTDRETDTTVNVRFDGHPDIDCHIPIADLAALPRVEEMIHRDRLSAAGELLIGLVAQLSDALEDHAAGSVGEQLPRLACLLRAVRDRDQVQLERDRSWYPAEYDGPIAVAEQDVLAAASTLIQGDVTWCAACYTGAAAVGHMRLATRRVGTVPCCDGCARTVAMRLHPAGSVA